MQNKTNKVKSLLLSIIKAIAIPLVVWIIMEVIVSITTGTSVIANSADQKTLFRNLISSLAFTLALSTNLRHGRMDLSLGSQMYVGVIFGGNLALMFNWGGVGVLICAAAIGGLCGLVTGLIFVNLRILPMVLGLGMTLVFECMCFAVNNQQGVNLYGSPGVEILSNASFIILIAVLIILVSSYLFQFSVFGFRYRAIQGSQKLASDAGINIFNNCVKSYLIAGVLVACAGVFAAAYNGSLGPVLGMSSNGFVFSNMFPMVLGIWIGSFVRNNQIGILMGSLSITIFNIGLSKFGLSTSMQSVILYSLFILFVVYNTNIWKFTYAKKKRARIALAESMLKQQAALAK